MVPGFSKAEMRQLREHAAEIYETEAHRILERLDDEFVRWRGGEMNSSELIHQIHRFHQNDARDLWTLYQSLKAYDIVARGVALGLLEPPLSEALQEKLAPLIETYRRHSG